MLVDRIRDCIRTEEEANIKHYFERYFSSRGIDIIVCPQLLAGSENTTPTAQKLDYDRCEAVAAKLYEFVTTKPDFQNNHSKPLHCIVQTFPLIEQQEIYCWITDPRFDDFLQKPKSDKLCISTSTRRMGELRMTNSHLNSYRDLKPHDEGLHRAC